MFKKYIPFAVIVGLLLAGYSSIAQTTTPTPTPTPSTTPKPGVNLACMQNAIEKRETALISAVDKYGASLKLALTVRKDALKAAWTITDIKERNKAINKAWDTFNKSTKATRKTLKEDRNSAWKQYRMDAKACNARGKDIEKHGERNDNWSD